MFWAKYKHLKSIPMLLILRNIGHNLLAKVYSTFDFSTSIEMHTKYLIRLYFSIILMIVAITMYSSWTCDCMKSVIKKASKIVYKNRVRLNHEFTIITGNKENTCKCYKSLLHSSMAQWQVMQTICKLFLCVLRSFRIFSNYLYISSLLCRDIIITLKL